MTKYDALRGYLEGRPGERVPVTFQELERLLGFPLPRSKQYPAWWSNNASNNTMTKVWLDAGFITEQVDTGAERLVFRRTAMRPRGAANVFSGASGGARTGVFPGFGCMKGAIRLPPDLDLTAPADPDWGKVFE